MVGERRIEMPRRRGKDSGKSARGGRAAKAGGSQPAKGGRAEGGGGKAKNPPAREADTAGTDDKGA
jgi:hypothetical protein